jgi:DNA-binding transcriptional LysR family regulator
LCARGELFGPVHGLKGSPVPLVFGQYFFVRTVRPLGYDAAVELRHLRYFVGVAEELNFTRAARKLRVAQPALSRQIRQLEDEVGVTLFERDRRGVRLTQAGGKFLEEARAVLDQTEKAIRAAQDTGNPEHGTLNLGYVWGLFHSVVPRVVENFRRAAPNVSVNLFDLTTTQQAEALRQGQLDLGFIGFAQEADTVGLARLRVGVCEFVVALPAKHQASRRRIIDLSYLAKEMFFTISEATYPSAARMAAAACAEAGFKPRIVQAAERGFTLLGLVAANCGVALVPETLAALPHPGVVFRPLTRPPRGDLFVAWQGKHESKVRDTFLARLQEGVGLFRRIAASSEKSGGTQPG